MQVIAALKSRRAGLGGIHAARVKLAANELSIVIAHVINNIFRSGVFPSELKKEPVHKKGDHGVLNNYRPITILRFFSKLIAKLIVTRL